MKKGIFPFIAALFNPELEKGKDERGGWTKQATLFQPLAREYSSNKHFFGFGSANFISGARLSCPNESLAHFSNRDLTIEASNRAETSASANKPAASFALSC